MTSRYQLLRSLTSSQSSIEAHVKGQIPEWVNGTLFRNGPGRFDYGNKSYKHLFDGHSCVHKFKIDNGKVTYSNKFLETKSYVKSSSENRLYRNFGTADNQSNIFSRLKSFFAYPDYADNVNINVVPFTQEKLYALTETNRVCQIDPKTLSIINTINVTDYLPSASTNIAHPHIESDGSWVTMGINNKGKIPHYEFIKYDATGKANQLNNLCENGKVIASVPSSNRSSFSYFHSFGISKNYIIFIEQSLSISINKLVMGVVVNKPLSDAMIVNSNSPIRIFVIDKNTGEVVKQKFLTDPMVLFHHINAYERPDPNDKNKIDILVDVCAYDSKHFDINYLSCENFFTENVLGKDAIKSTAKRITIPLYSNSSQDKDIYCPVKEINSNVAFEFPVINFNNYNRQPYKYIYGTNVYKKPFSIVKLNLENPNEVFEMQYSEGNIEFLPNEPVFFENPNPESEDDGVLLVMVLSEKNDFLSILDAKNLKEIARAEIPENVKGAFTFHGFFADSKNYKKLNS